MKDETLQQAKTCESNIKILSDLLQKLERGKVQIAVWNNQSGTAQDSYVQNCLGSDGETLKNVTTMLLKQFLQARIEQNQTTLDDL